MSHAANSNDDVLEQLIANYAAARAMWLRNLPGDGDLLSEGAIFEAFDEAGRAILRHPCGTAAARKISFVLLEDELYTMLKEDEDDGEDLLRLFLASLLTSEKLH